MAINILNKNKEASIVLSYMEDGKRVKHDVVIRYSDNDETYFSMPYPINFTKPKKKSDIEITYRSSVGVLQSVTKLIDCNMTMQEIMFTVKTPKIWEDKECRRSRRTECKLPITIEYADYKFKTESYDIATGGVSFVAPENMLTSYKKLPASVIMELGPDTTVSVNGKFVREKEHPNESDVKLYVYKFTHVSSLTSLMIKNYLIHSK